MAKNWPRMAISERTCYREALLEPRYRLSSSKAFLRPSRETDNRAFQQTILMLGPSDR